MATRGPQAGPVKVYYRGLQPLIKNLLALQGKLDNPDMSAPVRGAAKVYKEQFQMQGERFGGRWQRLSEYTQNIRRYRGFNPAHPVLKQSGNLRKIASDYPAGFKGKSMNRTIGGGGYSGAPQTTINIRTAPKRAIMMLAGDKVQNNFGGRVEGHGWQASGMHSLPRRPFWFVNGQVREEAAKALVESMKNELDKF